MPVKNLLVLTSQFRDIDDELVGDGVRIIKVSDALREAILEQNHKQIAEWDLTHGGYDHAFINVYDPRDKSDDEAEQEIVRATIIIKIIQPYSSGLHLVVTAEGSLEKPVYDARSRIGIGTNTYVCASDVGVYLTREHIRKARVLWPNIQTVCQQFQNHRRILRALRFFEIACSNYDGGIRHVLFHSGLETLLCTNRDYLGQQVRQRVLAICGPKVSKEDIRDITDMRGGLAHSGAIVEKAKGREEELIQKLERILRACLYHVLADRESVDIFSDDDKLKSAFPVTVKKVERKETDETIYI
jgi:hypothetical protein